MSEIINETINELNKPTQNNVFSIEDNPVTVLEKINQVERYLKQIDTHVDTSINTANEALEKANNAFEANGTLVKINGENQLTWSADFAESERQKSKNLFDLNYNGTFGSTTEISVSKYISLKSIYGEKFTINNNLLQYSFTRGSVGDIYTNIIFKNLKPSTTYTISFVPISVTTESTSVHFLGVYDVQVNLGTKVTRTITTDENGQFNTGYGIWISSQNATFTVSNVQLEEGSVATDYQPYNGAIVHEKDIEPYLIYDIDTKNTIGENAYINGIKFGAGTNINVAGTNINVAGYSKIKTYSRVYNTYNITEVVIDKTGWTGNSFMIFDGVPTTKNVGILIYHEGPNITPAECFNFSDNTTLNNNDNAYVYRIEGVK